MLLYFVSKVVIDKAHIHENQRKVLHVFLSTNGILKKLWMEIFRIQQKFAKFLETCYREKLQYLQGTTSSKDTAKLSMLTET